MRGSLLSALQSHTPHTFKMCLEQPTLSSCAVTRAQVVLSLPTHTWLLAVPCAQYDETPDGERHHPYYDAPEDRMKNLSVNQPPPEPNVDFSRYYCHVFVPTREAVASAMCVFRRYHVCVCVHEMSPPWPSSACHICGRDLGVMAQSRQRGGPESPGHATRPSMPRLAIFWAFPCYFVESLLMFHILQGRGHYASGLRCPA